MTNISFTHKREKKQKNAISCRIKKWSRVFLFSLISITLLLSSNWTLTKSNAQTDLDPAFQDSYWTDDNMISTSNTSTNDAVKKEVGPGEGTATLAVVLVNKARSDITAVKGYLSLPAGFKAIGVIPPGMGKNISDLSEYTVDSYDSIIKSGETFTLYFEMSVLKNANVGPYIASLDLVYSKVLETGQITVKNIAIPFRVTGKVVLDVVSEKYHLVPGSSNRVNITIKNKGTANASGVIVSVNEAPSTSNSLSSSNSSFTANGEGTESIPLVNIGNNTYDIGIIPANGTAEINPLVYPSNSAGETVQNLDLQISYGDAYGNRKNSDQSVGLVISPKPPQSILNIDVGVSSNNQNSSIVLIAGKIQELEFTIANEGKIPVTDLVITLTSRADTVKILGNSKWTFENLVPQSKLNLSTNVFASEDVIGKPIEFPVKIQYVSDEQSTTETINLGSYVDGEIRVRVYDLGINIIGDKPNLIGNLLNEGNTVALFTTVEMLKPPLSEQRSLVGSIASQQYLGDLTENSPLPFSIPLTIDNNTKAGTYPVFLKVSYRDNLRIPHELTINGSVDYEPIEQTTDGDRNTPAIIPILVILVISIVIATIVVLRKRRSKSKLSRILGIDNKMIEKEEEEKEKEREEDIGSLSDGPTDKKSDSIIDERKKG
ncbi:MAG: putative S-layer protein [Nitrososphaeraceae archaeon]|nr:putative S-layer protein [Nitrososphaeraceae archaeon]